MSLGINRKFILYTLGVYLIFTIVIAFSGYFNIGLLSDDYLNLFDALHSSLRDKLTGHLPFTNGLHLRPVYYLSMQFSDYIHNMLGLSYDNFINYRIENLLLYFVLAFTAGKIVLMQTGKLSLSVLTSLSIIVFPNNINNICWTAARVDILCGIFYVLTILCTILSIKKKCTLQVILSVIFLNLALLSKETALTVPFIVLLMCYYFFGKESIKENKLVFILQFAILAMYLSGRIFFLHNNLAEAGNLFQSSPLANIPGVAARSLIALTIPLDYLTLTLFMTDKESSVLIYLACLYGAVFYLVYAMIKNVVYKYMLQLLLLGAVLIIPYIYVGYIRPQMILIPFVILLIQLFSIYNQQAQFNIHFKKHYLKYFYAVSLVFWCYWSIVSINNWSFAYEKGKQDIISLTSVNITPHRQTIIIGNPGRFKNTLMFDKLTGSYNYWKNKSSVINDTLNDLIQTGALKEIDVGAVLKYVQTAPNVFEISTLNRSQFFYIEGLDNERIKSGFSNSYMDVQFSDFNFFNKPAKLTLKILSPLVDCYIAGGFSFERITN